MDLDSPAEGGWVSIGYTDEGEVFALRAHEIEIIGPIRIRFEGGVRVLGQDGQVLREHHGYELFALNKRGRLARYYMSTGEWVARTLATAPPFGQRQINHGRRVKRELIERASARQS